MPGINTNPAEHWALADYFFNRPGDFHRESGRPRRLTLALLLDLCERLQDSDIPLTVEPDNGLDVFRACAYGGLFPAAKSGSLVQ